MVLWRLLDVSRRACRNLIYGIQRDISMAEECGGAEVWSQFDGNNLKQTMHMQTLHIFVQTLCTILFMIDITFYMTILYKYFTYVLCRPKTQHPPA